MKKWLTIFWNMLTTNRAKSLYWRTSMMVIAGFFKFLSDEAPLIPDMPADTAVFLGLVLGEISKSVSNFYKKR